MKKSNKFLLILTVILTVIVAWKMTGPEYDRYGQDTESIVRPYALAYPIGMAFYGVMVSLLLSFTTRRAKFFGSISAVALGIGLTALLVATVMHSHPVHSLLMQIVFCSVLLLLFYSGYTLADWRGSSASE